MIRDQVTDDDSASRKFRPVTSLLIAIHRVFPHGGLQRDALQTAREARTRGLTATIMCQSFEGARPEGVEVEVAQVSGVSNHTRAKRFGELVARRSDRDPDQVILGFDKMPGLDLYFAGDRCYVERVREERGMLGRWTPRYRTYRALERDVFSPTSRTRILALHERQRDVYRKEYGTPAERFTVLPPGIAIDRRKSDRSDEDRGRIRREFGVRDEDHLLLLLGSDFHRKGLDRAIESIALLSREVQTRVHLIAVGADGAERFRSLAMSRGVSDRVIIVNARDDVPALLAAADLLVHPARTEAGGAVLLEALVSGTPVIATDVCGYSPHVEAAGAGVVLGEPFCTVALLDAIARTLSSSRDELAKRALEYSAAHPEFHAMHGVIIDEVLASRSR